METKRFKVKTREKVALHVERVLPDGAPRACVLIVHGMAEHKGRYASFAQFLASHGFAVYTYDQRGCGKTRIDTLPWGFMDFQNGWERLLDDCQQLIGFIEAEQEGVPLVLLGHSMGSLVARVTAARKGRHLAGLVLSGTSAPPGLKGAFGAYLAGLVHWFTDKKQPSPFLDRLLFKDYNQRIEAPRTRFDWLSRDESVVDAYLQDEACGFVCPASFYLELIKGARQAWRPRTFERTDPALPILLLSGEEDPVGDYGTGVRLAARRYRDAGVRHVHLALYEGGRHEMLNEWNRREVYQDVLAFLDERVAPKALQS